jgi:4-hydroxybenzoate polyprenyltransferase
MEPGDEKQRGTNARPADAVIGTWVDRAPLGVQPFLRLSRYDRPAGIWLLAIPCWLGLALAQIGNGWTTGELKLSALFLLGAVAMRGAGCTWNDIVDRDLDAGVARTAGRPIPAGQVSVRAALLWTLVQCGVGLFVLLQLNAFAQVVALMAIPLVALYPLMKRITWWPQVWLGLTFNWGVLVAAAATQDNIAWGHISLYIGLIAWTIAYDTIYALQDIEDDALIGVKSTARRFGDRWPRMCVFLYGVSAIGLVASGMGSAALSPLVASVVFFAAGLLCVRRTLADRAQALPAFKSHVAIGIIACAAFGLEGLLRTAT